MNQTVKQWVADFHAKHTQAQNILGKPDFNDTDKKQVDDLNAELKSLKFRIESAKETEVLGSFLTVGNYLQAAGNFTDVLGSSVAGKAQITTDENGVTIELDRVDPAEVKAFKASQSAEYKGHFRTWLRAKGEVSQMPLTAAKAIMEGVDSLGGVLVPEDMRMTIVEKKPAPTVLVSKVQGFTTSRDRLTMPRVKYTADDIYTNGIRVTKTGEVPASSTVHQTTEPVMGTFQIGVNTWMLSLPISNDMVEDAGFDIEGYISRKFSEAIDLLKENQIVNGSGVGENLGFIPSLVRGGAEDIKYINTGDANKLTPDSLIRLKRAVPPQYAQSSSLGFVMEYSNTGGDLETMKDGGATGKYIFRTGGGLEGGLQGDAPDTLLGRAIAYSQFMPSVAAGNFPIVYGDWSAYYFLNRIGFSLQVLREVGALNNQIILVGRVRFGGMPVENWKLKGLRVAAN